MQTFRQPCLLLCKRRRLHRFAENHPVPLSSRSLPQNQPFRFRVSRSWASAARSRRPVTSCNRLPVLPAEQYSRSDFGLTQLFANQSAPNRNGQGWAARPYGCHEKREKTFLFPKACRNDNRHAGFWLRRYSCTAADGSRLSTMNGQRHATSPFTDYKASAHRSEVNAKSAQFLVCPFMKRFKRKTPRRHKFHVQLSPRLTLFKNSNSLAMCFAPLISKSCQNMRSFKTSAPDRQ